MEIVLAAAGAVAVALLVQRPRAAGVAPATVITPERPEVAPGPAAQTGSDGHEAALEDELRARRSEIARLEERLRAREGSIDLQAQRLDERERSLDDRKRNLQHSRDELKEDKARQLRELERVA